MELILIILILIPAILTGLIFMAFLIASIMDLIHYRRNRLFIELSRDHSKPRRPAAK